MTYYAGNGSTNPLTFPTYPRANLPQRHLSGLVALSGSGNHLQQQYERQQLAANMAPPNMVPAANMKGDRPSTAATADTETAGTDDGRPSSSITSDQASTSEPPKKRSYKRYRQNRPGHKFGAKKRSWVWNWFVQDGSDPNVAICDYCGKVVTRRSSDKGSPKKLTEHLKTHKLTPSSINAARTITEDEPEPEPTPFITNFHGPNLHVFNAYNPGTSGKQGNTPSADEHPQSSPPSHSPPSRTPVNIHKAQKPSALQQEQHPQQHPQQHQQHSQQHSQREEVADLSDLKSKIYRRTHGSGHLDNGAHSSLGAPQRSDSPQHMRGTPQLENSPYSSSKFHRHLLNFLAENKLSIRLLKSPSFQQLIYDLRPESMSDLVELTGLFSSFVEVSRLDNGSESQAALAEANAASALAQELVKK